MKLLQINTVLNRGSTGRIMEGIGTIAKEAGYDSYAAYGVLGSEGTQLNGITIGSKADRYLHGLQTRVLDRHGFASRKATETFINKVREINPDVIGLHNLHGYYLNVELLFRYLREAGKPVIWTFHDCWPFTGHCCYFDRVDCEKWKTECHNCPLKTYYPASYGLDNSRNNFHQKKELFTGLKNLTIVTPSHWLKDLVQKSFLKEYPVRVIHNGIDLETFSPGTEHLPAPVKNVDKKIVLGVASVWDDRKGLQEFVKLTQVLKDEYQVVLAGLSSNQISSLPKEILGIARTENAEQLASLYSAAEAFVNPTFSDNFPTTNIEALACGTPVITYNTGGSPEAVDKITGFVVEKGDNEGIVHSLNTISEQNRHSFTKPCRNRAVQHYSKEDRFRDYVELYKKMMGV